MATVAEKQAWLVAQGKPKSYSYFMTGPNLGPDWDWDQAIAGSYSNAEVDGFLTAGETKYKAHKSSSKAKKPAGDLDTPASGPPTACAKSAAKHISQWVAVAVKNADEWYTNVGASLSGGAQTYTEGGTFIQTMKKHIADAVAEVGDQADEVIALRQMLDVMEHVERSRLSTLELNKVKAAVQFGKEQDTPALIQGLDKLRTRADAIKTVDTSKAAALFDVFDDADDVLQKIVLQADHTIRQNQRVAVGWTWQRVAKDQADDWASHGLPLVLNDTPHDAYFNVTSFVQTASEVSADTLNEAADIIDSLRQIDGLNALWRQQIVPDADNYAIIKSAMDLQGDIAKEIRLSVGSHINAYTDMTDLYQNGFWWEAGNVEGNLAGSPLEFWAQKYGNDSSARILGEAEEMNDLLKSLNGNGVFGSQDIWEGIAENLTDFASKSDDVFVAVLEKNKFNLPGLTPTKAEVLAKLDDGYVTQIQGAGTDELNPIVQDKLEESGESKTLTYFMTKEQKQDYILLPNETFDTVEYSIKYKGEQLNGKGLSTAKHKYDLKNGKIKTATPVQASKEATEAATDSITGAVESYSAPPGSPKWWSDGISDAQDYVIFQEASKNTSFSDAWVASGAENLNIDGKVTKGQASQIIGQIKDGKTTWTVDEIDEALAYGQKKVIHGGDDAVKAAAANIGEPDPVDLQAAVSAVTDTAPKSTTVQTTSSAAPLNNNWDTPHTFEYVGDGRKWGGAHRKWHFTDEDGADWMLKHGEDFRAEGELAAHKVGQAAGFDIAEARVSTQQIPGTGKQTGFMQKMYSKSSVKGELDDVMSGGSFVGIEDDITRQVQEHQVLDWLIGNHDGHKQNFLVLRDGRVVGIDKGQAFKFMGKDALSADYTPPGNFGEVAYNRMWAEFRAGKIDLDLDVIDAALRRIEQIDDETYAAFVRTYADGRFAAGRSVGYLQGTSAQSADELVELALERKRNIRKQFTAFYEENAKARGVTWTPKWAVQDVTPTAAKKTVKALKPTEIITKLDEEFLAGVDAAGSAGKAAYVSGADVERGQVLFDIAVDSKGNEVLRVNAVLRPDADKRVLRLFAEEGGDKLTAAAKTSAPLPTTPQQVTQAAQLGPKTVNGAKTINHHISSGDFEFNLSTIQAVQDEVDKLDTLKAFYAKSTVDADTIPQEAIETFLAKYDPSTIDAEDLDKFLVQWVEKQATDSTTLKSIQVYEPHMQEVVTQGTKGNAAAKVANVPDWDGIAHYENLKDDALKRGRAVLQSEDLAKHIEVPEPTTVFKDIRSRANRSYQVKLGTPGRKSPLVSDQAREIGGLRNAYVGQTNDGVEMIYRNIDGNFETHQGWMEVVIKTDGKVTQADIDRAYGFIRNDLGVKMDLATTEDMELTYWRVVNGSYRNSREGTSVSSKYYKAIQQADQNVTALGPNPTPAQEVDAIRSAYRAQFGSQIDDADFMPIHSHALTEDVQEVGWGYFERPEVGDTYDALRGKIVYHDIAYGDGEVRTELLQGATGDALMSQQRRQQLGFVASSASPGPDLKSGGSAGLFSRIGSADSPRKNYVIMNPNRVHRRLGNYNAVGDTYGNLSQRSANNTLSAKQWAGQASRGNETMLRDGVNWIDDVEIAFFPSDGEARRAVTSLQNRGITHIRGVSVEERFVFAPNPRQYTKDFFDRYVGREGFSERLRRTATELVAKGKKKVAAVKGVGSEIVSRLKTKVDASGVPQLAKKLSSGRQASIGGYFNNKYAPQAVRYHNAENAVTVSLDTLENSGVITTQATGDLETLMSQAGVKNWTPVYDIKFKLNRSQYTGSGVTIDLADYGVDLPELSKYARPQVLREFVRALMDNTLDEFATKWGGVVA